MLEPTHEIERIERSEAELEEEMELEETELVEAEWESEDEYEEPTKPSFLKIMRDILIGIVLLLGLSVFYLLKFLIKILKELPHEMMENIRASNKSRGS